MPQLFALGLPLTSAGAGVAGDISGGWRSCSAPQVAECGLRAGGPPQRTLAVHHRIVSLLADALLGSEGFPCEQSIPPPPAPPAATTTCCSDWPDCVRGQRPVYYGPGGRLQDPGAVGLSCCPCRACCATLRAAEPTTLAARPPVIAHLRGARCRLPGRRLAPEAGLRDPRPVDQCRALPRVPVLHHGCTPCLTLACRAAANFRMRVAPSPFGQPPHGVKLLARRAVASPVLTGLSVCGPRMHSQFIFCCIPCFPLPLTARFHEGARRRPRLCTALHIVAPTPPCRHVHILSAYCSAHTVAVTVIQLQKKGAAQGGMVGGCRWAPPQHRAVGLCSGWRGAWNMLRTR